MRTYVVLFSLVCLLADNSLSQTSQQVPGTAAPGNSSDQQTPQTATITSAPATPQPSSQSLGVFSGGGRVDKLVPQVLDISIIDAIDRGIRHNLGLLLSQEQTQTARAAYRRALSSLLPNISGRVNDSVQQINLAAFGIPLPAGLSSPVVGPFNVFDARAALTETFLDFNALNRVRQSAENEKTVRFTVQDARELVVLVVGNEYLLTIASAARLDTAKAQFNTAETIFRQTQDLKNAGVAAGIDVLRAQVQMQTQQQRVLAADQQYQQQRMVLARVIGLPVAQQYRLTDTVPYAPLPELNLKEELEHAYTQRPEYLAAESRTRVAELGVKAAKGEALPTASVNGDWGYLGQSFPTLENTYTLAAGVRIPIFQGGKVRADVAQAESDLHSAQLQLEDLHNRVEQEVRSALLDVKTSDQQVAVARQSINLSNEQLKQSQDRFQAGVSGTLEVVQAQEAVATSNEQYIQSLYVNNVAKLTLARALGVAEKQVKAFLGGK
ncbi:MAG TPA: TolC family protein [Candidatus Angelobacter sp.]|jgi:outer membrane protein TolC|nr:TolC family protein [Candidatus Angelobacter sp.]